MAAESPDRRHRQLRPGAKIAVAVGLVVAVASAVSLLGYGPLAGFTHDRGHPDPGGHRVAAIAAFAPQALPSSATGVQVSVHGYRWDPQSCDGAAPGWTSAHVDQTFHAPRSVLSSLDDRMRRLKWKRDEPSQPSSNPAPAQPPDGTRVYVPAGANPYGEAAVLTAPETFGAGRWDFDVSADPATTPSHDC